MTLKEYAEKEGITLTEAQEKLGLETSQWNQKVGVTVEKLKDAIGELEPAHNTVPLPELTEEVAEVVDSAKELLKESQDVMKILMKDGITAEEALIGAKFIGVKSKYYPFIKVLKTLVD